MKNTLLVPLFSMLCVALCSCEKGEPQMQSEPEPEPIKQIELFDDENYICFRTSHNAETLKIVSGNGGYDLVFPKFIYLDAVNGNNIDVPYSEYNEEIFSLRIDEADNIVIERKSLFDRWIYGVFMVRDSKGARKLFAIDCIPGDSSVAGLPVGVDYLWGHLTEDESYWVNY